MATTRKVGLKANGKLKKRIPLQRKRTNRKSQGNHRQTQKTLIHPFSPAP